MRGSLRSFLFKALRAVRRARLQFVGVVFFCTLWQSVVGCLVWKPSFRILHLFGVTLTTSAPFWSQFCHLGITFGALGMHLSCPKTDLGSKGAPRGASPIKQSPFWAPFGGHFSYSCDILRSKSVFLKYITFFLLFWVPLSTPREGLICNPYTPVQSKHTFPFSYFL